MKTIHRKNEEYDIRILDIGADGEGIGHLDDGYTLFVNGALPGDMVRARIIKAQKKYGIARLMEILKPSLDRTAPKCPIADRCGGCRIAALTYDAQLRYKSNKVRELLIRVGGFPEELIDEIFEGIIGYYDEKSGETAPERFRNKAQYPVGTDGDGHTVTGFYAPHSHRIVPCTDCLIGASTDGIILKVIRDFMDEYGVRAYDESLHLGLVRHILIRTGYETGEIQVCVVINGDEIPHADVLSSRICAAVADRAGSDPHTDTVPGTAVTDRHVVSICTSTNIDETNVILGSDYRVISGTGYMTDRIDDLEFRISPLSFYQVNPVQTRKLYAKALEYASLTGTETVWDLYCGIGTISLFLARSAGMVYGVEVIPEAIEDARANARLNGIDNVEFMVGKAEEVLPGFYASHSDDTADRSALIPDDRDATITDEQSAVRPDVIVVDPPRKGCDRACLDTMLRMQPDRIVYVSCDPATLARDLKILCEDGAYELTHVSCTDMFSGSVHVETVVSLVRK